jgi:hypothetical protein
MFWSWLSRTWPRWREALVLVQPQTVIAWRRRRFRQYWTKLSRAGQPGRPAVAPELRQLIRRLSTTNPLWGAPRLVGELAKIGIDLAQSTGARYMVRRRRPASTTWRAFLKNHLAEILAVDFFVVPTVRNQVLFVFLVYVQRAVMWRRGLSLGGTGARRHRSLHITLQLLQPSQQVGLAPGRRPRHIVGRRRRGQGSALHV